MAEIDLKSVPRNELGILGGAVVAFLGLFFHAYTVKIKGFGTGHLAGWHFVGLWLPTLLLLAAAAFVAVRRFRPDVVPELPVGPRILVAGVAIVALLWVVIRALTYPTPGSGFGGVSAGAGLGTYIVCLAVAVATAFAVLDFRESGEKVPSMPKAPTTGDAA